MTCRVTLTRPLTELWLLVHWCAKQWMSFPNVTFLDSVRDFGCAAIIASCGMFPDLWKEFKRECLNLTMKHLLKIIMIWCCMAPSEVGHCRWSVIVTKYIGILLKCMVIYLYSSIPVSVLLDGWQWAMASCKTGHLLEVPEQHQDVDLDHPITGYESDWEFLA